VDSWIRVESVGRADLYTEEARSQSGRGDKGRDSQVQRGQFLSRLAKVDSGQAEESVLQSRWNEPRSRTPFVQG